MSQEAELARVDQRYLVARSGQMRFTFPSYDTLAAWETRAAWLREHIAIVVGLWPTPEKAPLKPRLLGRIAYDDYVIENVAFESWPGFLCTGNLYRPRRITAPVPAILNPHGHWGRGRLEHQELGSIRTRCITFARMGMIAFASDMVGYNDSLQVPTHRFATPVGALWGISPMALQTWNSIRAVDFLQSLDEVDPERIGCTGASGGGTQTFTVTAIEPRIKVVAPVNMISAHMQGGCVCENIPGLRTQTYNVEIGALAAPRPMLMVSATGDWTVNTPRIEYPAIRSIYQLYGADDKLAWGQVDAPHNYNAESRGHVYRWFARWFLGDEELGRDAERDFVVEPDERMRLFPGGALPQELPVGAALEAALRQGAQERLQALWPATPAQLDELRRVTRARLEHVLGVVPPQPSEVIAELGEIAEATWGRSRTLALGRRGAAERIPAVEYLPAGKPTRIILAVHEAGLEGWLDGLGEPGALIHGLLAQGYGVLALAPFHTGAAPEGAVARDDRNWFWATFNAPLLGQRVQDILTALAYLQGQGETPPGLLGWRGAGAWCLLAGALSPVGCAAAADMTAGAEEDDTYLGELYAPLMRAYGGLPVAAALVAPRPLLLGDAAPRFADWARAAYQAVGASAKLAEQREGLSLTMLLNWLGSLS